MSHAVDPTPEQFAALASSGHPGPVQMVNLLAFAPDGGRASYAEYEAAVQPHLDRVGGRVVSGGGAVTTVIGDEAWWDAILVVEYPSVAAFVEMVRDPDYQAITPLRTRALTRAALVATAPGLPSGG